MGSPGLATTPSERDTVPGYILVANDSPRTRWQVLHQHSNEYRPPKAGENQKEWQKSLLNEDPQAKNP